MNQWFRGYWNSTVSNSIYKMTNPIAFPNAKLCGEVSIPDNYSSANRTIIKVAGSDSAGLYVDDKIESWYIKFSYDNIYTGNGNCLYLILGY